MEIPRHRLTIRASRSGGPGGQNVNKVATKIEVRFVVDEADWIPARARERLKEREARRINMAGELVITSSRHREQSRNLEDCLAKLAELIALAGRRPVPRVATKPTRASKKRRLEGKRRRGLVKDARRHLARDE